MPNVELMSFQSNGRETDFCLHRVPMMTFFFIKNDFIGPVGTYDFHFISGAPQEKDSLLTLVRPYDYYIWALLLVSLVLVSVTLILINKLYATFSKQTFKETTTESKKK